ncbi:MAG: Hint domain [Rhodobacteraceae bacterium HLUCCA08]|nr:MAG: Hint domain [Rhodobacteraceae bacterium HLUCCA08]
MHLGLKEAFDGATAVDTRLKGLTAGTTILTLDGELPVEHLSPGDKVITRDSGVAVLRGLRMVEVHVAPIAIKAGSLGYARPDRDILVAPDTPIHIRDWRAEALFGAKAATVPAKRLVDGEFVAEVEMRRMVLWELDFDRPHIVYADGLEVASDLV